jgi:probable HAF family extracellular repeat protein
MMQLSNSLKISFALFAFVFVSFADVSLATMASFRGLGDLPGGSFYSYAHDVSADGSVVVGYGISASGLEAVRWENGIITSMGDLPGGDSESRAYSVSTDGSVIVGYGTSTSGDEAVYWKNDTVTRLGATAALDVSADGSVIVGYSYSSVLGFEAIRWVNGNMTVLGHLLGQTDSAATSISADGLVVVGHSESSVDDCEAFRWENGVMTGLGDLPGGTNWSRAVGVSANGLVVVGQSNSSMGYEAFRWESGIMKSLGGGPYSGALDASADGSLIVGVSDGAFIWDVEGGMQDLQEVLINDYGLERDLAGWTLYEASAISDDGFTIVGNGINPDGYIEGWMATIPEPATFLMLALGVFVLQRKRFR